MKSYNSANTAKAQATRMSNKTGHVHLHVQHGDEWMVGTKAEINAFIAELEAAKAPAEASAHRTYKGVTIEQVQAQNLPLLEAIKAYGTGNYNKGWDVIIECWTDEDITQYIGKTRTLYGAIAKLYSLVSLRKEQEANCQ